MVSLFLLLFLLLSTTSGDATSPLNKTILPWMCLERCGEDISSDFNQIITHAFDLGAVSFEAYDLADPGSSAPIVWNNFTDVNKQFLQSSAGTSLNRLAMITSVNLNWMRELFQNSDLFISQAVSLATTRNFTGFNIDFEPSTAASSNDGVEFARFISKFSASLHQSGKLLTVDLGHLDSGLYNFSLIGQSGVDRAYTMVYSHLFINIFKIVSV